MFRVFWWMFICVFMGREVGCSIDSQNRDIGGKPQLISISVKWKWLIKQKQSTYADKTKILKDSITSHFIGYLFGLAELFLLLLSVFGENKLEMLVAADILFYFFVILIVCGVLIPNGFRYERNMQKTYEYDWITFFQEVLTQKSKRKCKIVNIIDEKICEIEFLRGINKGRYRAETEEVVKIGEVRYAIHFYHTIDEDKPYWVVKSH